ncbi:hypothetical protein SAMN05444003_0997 [Cognatiyoonia sediminum]|uniref:Uncharacterized protein n=1 Tax=Cognatiyoonia sediminum TaxID=1508389 RepID=A0A1M5MS75_9RHOB|nr:hypothetical protein SAMN05444003_0997 [Cognatiyoonia sediminum]
MGEAYVDDETWITTLKAARDQAVVACEVREEAFQNFDDASSENPQIRWINDPCEIVVSLNRSIDSHISEK